MCNWCDENGGELTYCQNCGRELCWDFLALDDVTSPPSVTTTGDVYCLSCGKREQDEIDRVEEEEADEYGWNHYPYSWYDEDMDFADEDANGVDFDNESEAQS
ncbi:MAG: hypothetical protein LCI00_16760 [Chloroflexi bacterium]|nr:hypothetical protein [Chloroflexota bacterium]